MTDWINKSVSLLTTSKNTYVEGEEEGDTVGVRYFELQVSMRLLGYDAQK